MTSIELKQKQLSQASYILGILAIASTVTVAVIFPFIFGSLAILCAILSKGRDTTFLRRAKSGFYTGILAIILNILFLIVAIYMIFAIPEYHDLLNTYSQQLYGQTFDEMLQLLKTQ
ncbi:MAG: hypothetical protein ACRC7V_06625 [Lachnospiraceae bacterium]